MRKIGLKTGVGFALAMAFGQAMAECETINPMGVDGLQTSLKFGSVVDHGQPQNMVDANRFSASLAFNGLDVGEQYATIGQLQEILVKDLNYNQKMLIAFYGMVGTESGYKHFGGVGSQAGKNAPTTSTANAIGLAQVRMIAFKEVERVFNIKLNQEEFCQNPDYNFYVGMTYFAMQLENFDNNYENAIAAYNAGPSYVQRQIRKYGSEWLDAPDIYEETKNYTDKNIAKLEKNWQAYGNIPAVQAATLTPSD